MIMKLSVHGSYKRFAHIIPVDAQVIEHPYTDEPFSHFYTISKNDKELDVWFGTGGYYPDAAEQKIQEFFN